MNEITDAIYDGRKKISKKKIHRFLMSLYHEDVFRQVNESYQGPLNTRWFEFARKGIDKEALLGHYHDAVIRSLKDKFPEMSNEILEQIIEK
jgi:hypothetical protein